MPYNFQKFLFLGALLLSVAWSSQTLKNKINPVLERDYFPANISAANVNYFPAESASNNFYSANQALLRGANPLPSPALRRAINGQSPELQTKIALVADLKTGEDYFRYNGGQRWPMASVTKLATAVMALENINQTSIIVLSASDFADASEQPVPYLKIGDKYSVSDLLKILLLASRNEVAAALARFYGSARFTSALNGWAAGLNLNSTYFKDVSGLSASNQSTAEDLKILAKEIYYHYPEIFKITREKEAFVTELNSGTIYKIPSIDFFAGQPDFLGGKTGYTDEADGNLLSIFSYKNEPILVVVMGSTDRFGDTNKLTRWFEDNYR